MKIFLGSTGLKFLTFGLRTIDCLDKLSLKYCNIDKTGAKWIQEIIANINSKLRSLKLTGIFLIGLCPDRQFYNEAPSALGGTTGPDDSQLRISI